jgi:hypothetical protein
MILGEFQRLQQQADPTYQLEENSKLADAYYKLHPDQAPMSELDKARLAEIQANTKKASRVDARAKFGLNPQTGVDAGGNAVLLQLGDNGEAVATKMPDGVKLSKEPIKLDAGTSFILLDPITRLPIGSIPKDIAGEAAARAQGTAQGAAQNELSAAAIGAKQTVQQIDDLLGDKNLDASIGTVQGWIPTRAYGVVNSSIPGVRAKIDQIKGNAFLNAYSTLKGAGAITEVEGQKATAALARLDQAQSDSDFKTALQDMKAVLQTGIDKLAARAQQPSPQINGGYTPAQLDAAKKRWGLSSDTDAAGKLKANGVQSQPVTINGYTIQRVQ